jgi:hypothetical protein
MAAKKEKLKKIYRFFTIYFIVIIFILVFPPIVKLFDRTDIWIGIMPLSQFYILFFVGLVVLGMGILYRIDKKYSGRDK